MTGKHGAWPVAGSCLLTVLCPPLLQGIFITVHSTPYDESKVISKVDAFEKNLFGSDKAAATASD